MTVRKERGWQTQKKGWMASQVRTEELRAKAVTIDGRKDWYCRFCSETNVHKVEVSQVSDKHSVSVASHTHAGCINQEWSKLVGIVIIM